ncbi:MAG: PTS sugar transporter subunit IIA [Gemmatimonadetes bacterium]|nr:PTS sugar transporter subunit IIA [Gemmatimonadota bacterium]
MWLSDLLTPQRIKVPITGQDKGAVLRELVALVAEDGPPEFDEILRAVEERERVLSTGVGHGVAIPHGKSHRVQALRLAAGASAAPVAFEALDGQPVRLFFLLIGPENNPGADVKALSRISRLVRREPFRAQLLAARNAEEFYRFLCEAETR